ncbi:Coproporphyrinogen-III oxidase HemN (oxygen-independent) or related Fe-S oxidoreductase (HemN) (PDB:1OLT) [Commensalibacter communis]|uniref:oxygen-independent coproporphyrinogen III oxidase n=1 Tax=Commensalibacter communis TaxID=2972786 RepID=UPI0022FFAFC4|nr:oxygen-independent coproporphyrinogen III oxidase [Commensalibacter communis]CAI3936542.1 Coproporphyrinogen-III oxidase HemN (oxygen-independent) or related Fe-S oxidoreductase (HemN) (PDB:1OLT) [Commensalibacter communis]CAI3941673.1 Coproporphyrinogen-III oxidase HemN (oxygen-independent) or related Fe-S oxidoreductase (HemN) (PDB:1OLT) [Commensalibacter communis]CAI3944874.1 Coproporphyrinogen-III oxidase HemN (oxygen-independent) or related Fe-S oxidoreductase (HemN) (PDB:1OLT) [Commensa
MKQVVSFDRLARYEGNLPRYTSYPTAVQFTDNVGFSHYKEWLQALPTGEPVSLYLHVPFCDELCKFCACNTQVVNQESIRSAYGDLLCEELKRLAGFLQTRRSVSFIHFGGGTPTTLPMNAMKRVMQTIYSLFDIQEDADISIELDPRHVSVEYFSMLHPLGFTRVSFGVQDLDPKVQKACGRIQSKELTAHCIDVVRQNHIQSVNVDLIYGLPNQTVESLRETIHSVVELKPDRLAVFGYAHVPWKFKRQTLLEGDVLPDSMERFQQRQVIDEILQEAGYQVIGLDHYALPHDSMSKAAQKGTLHRNFQGYTIDNAPALLGVGASSVSIVPQGIVQNHASVAMYQKAMSQEGLPIARGVERDEEDLLRWTVIERLMCDLYIDLNSVTRQYNKPNSFFDEALAKLKTFEEDGLVRVEDYKITVTEEGRCFLRNIVVVFDTYYRVAPQRHAQAI